MQEWKQLYPHNIQSPEQLPMLADLAKLTESLLQHGINKPTILNR